MSQRTRFDEPGAWLHVMNRGVARRTIFETRADARYFLACLARAVRAGWFEVHALVLLTTHFHLLIRSLTGEAWRGLRRVQNAYARRFNIQRRRDGGLFRGRFCSKRVGSERYWLTVVRYIDRNALAAGLVDCPEDWPYGSAAVYLGARTGPPWLSREVVEAVATDGGLRAFGPDVYRARFHGPQSDAQAAMVERRLESAERADDAFDDLVGATPRCVARWMRRKAALADGTSPGVAVVGAATLDAALIGYTPPTSGVGASTGDAHDAQDRDWTAIRAGLLRWVAGVTYREIAARLQCSEAAAHGRVRAFGQLVAGGHPLVETAVDVLTDVLQVTWPDEPLRSVVVPGLPHHRAIGALAGDTV